MRKKFRQFALDEDLGAALKICAIKKGKKLIHLKPEDIMSTPKKEPVTKSVPVKKKTPFRYSL